jgi:hypothetical protein
MKTNEQLLNECRTLCDVFVLEVKWDPSDTTPLNKPQPRWRVGWAAMKSDKPYGSAVYVLDSVDSAIRSALVAGWWELRKLAGLPPENP